MAHSTSSAKPSKPYPEFPLFPHATKRWAKKIRGRFHYFGPWADWQGALERYQYEVDYLQQGKTPPPKDQAALTVGDLVNRFLEHKEAKVESGELAKRTWNDYKLTGTMLVASLGRHTSVESLTSSDFAKLRNKLSESLGLMALGNEIGRCKVFFNFAYKDNLIDHPVKMGLSFAKPNRKSVKREKESKSAKIFTIDELRTLYHAADKSMQAFMLLALNCGFGNGDIGQLEFRHIVNGWIDYPRPKTLVNRKCPLWAETISAIAKAKQTKHIDELPYVFVTKYGQSWFKESGDSPISKEFNKLCKETNLHQVGRGFYSLRHQFRTVADGCRDAVAIGHIMGHSDDSMAANYREWIEPERLQAVVDHVYAWVKPMFKKKAGAK